MLRVRIRYLLVLAVILVMARDAVACRRLRYWRYISPCECRGRVVASTTGMSAEAEEALRRLRTVRRNKSDSEIIQEVRAYVSENRSTLRCGTSWFAERVHQAKLQRKATEWVEKAGGWVWQVNSDFGPLRTAPKLPPMDLWNELGSDFFFGPIIEVSLRDADAGAVNSGLGNLRGLPNLWALRFDAMPVTDAGLEPVKDFSELRGLWLVGPSTTDGGLRHLEGLVNLRELWLMDTKITDDGLKYLRGLTQLRRLVLDNTAVTDAGLEYLKGLAQLETLGLNGTKVTKAGVSEIRHALPGCRVDHAY